MLAADPEAWSLFHRGPAAEDQSSVDWRLGMQLVRAGVHPQRVHLALRLRRELTLDPAGDKKRGREDYFRRTVSKLFARARYDLVAQINANHALVIQGGVTAVIRETEDPETGDPIVELTKPQAIREFFDNQRIQVGRGRWVGAGTLWTRHPLRRTYERIVFSPAGTADASAYNLWRGFNFTPSPGDCSIFWDHVLCNVCDGDASLCEWITAWMAFLVQRLAEVLGTAVVLRGRQGTGKGAFAKTLGKLFGPHFAHVSTPDGLTRNFNAHLLNKRLVFADESFWAGDKRAAGILKALVTEETMQIEMKHRDAFSVRNHLCLILASNNEWVVPAGAAERRFAVFEVGEGRMQDRDYFREMIRQLEGGGYEALLHDLLTFDLQSCEADPQVIPHTGALLAQKIRSLPPLEAWWFEKLREGRVFGRPWLAQVATKQLYDDYHRFCDDHGQRRELESRAAFGAAMKELAPGLARRQIHVRGSGGKKTRPYIYRFPPLAHCRAAFERRLGQSVNWED